MHRKNATSTRRARRPARPNLHVESLEQRHMFAGDVSARLVGSTLHLDGDVHANRINVATVPGGRVAVLGADTTVNGSPAAFVTDKPATNIVVSLAGGDDVIGFTNAARGLGNLFGRLRGGGPQDPIVAQAVIDAVSAGMVKFSLPGFIRLAMGDGNDTVAIVGDVGGSTTADLGPSTSSDARAGNLFGIGGNASWITDPLLTSSVGGSVSVTGGSRADAGDFFVATVGGSLTAALGSGANGLSVEGCTIRGGCTVVGAGDGDTVYVGDCLVAGPVNLALGDGANVATVTGTLMGLERTRVGSIRVTAGAGADRLVVGDLDVRQGVRIASGAGADDVRIGAGPGATVGGDVHVDTGVGADDVVVDRTVVRGKLAVTLGGGDDRLSIRASQAVSMWLFGGPGVNTLTLLAVAPGGIRRFRFQPSTG